MFLPQGTTGGNGRWGSLCVPLAECVITLKEAVGYSVVRTVWCKVYGLEGFSSGTGKDLTGTGQKQTVKTRDSHCPGGITSLWQVFWLGVLPYPIGVDTEKRETQALAFLEYSWYFKLFIFFVGSSIASKIVFWHLYLYRNLKIFFFYVLPSHLGD